MFLRTTTNYNFYLLYYVFVEATSILLCLKYPPIIFGLIALNNLACALSYMYIYIYNKERDHNLIIKYRKILGDTNLYGLVGLIFVMSHMSYLYSLIKIE